MNGGRTLFSGTNRDQWTQLKLNDLCVHITSGGTPSRRVPTYYIDGVYPWVKTQELCDTWINDTEEHITPEAIAQSSAKILPKNTVLVAMYGATVGKLGLLRQPMTCNQACCALIVDDQKADYRFIFYHLLQDRDRLKNLATGAAQQNLSGEVIKSLKFWIPPLPEQRRIAHILGTLDDKIENNRKTAKTLEAMAQAIFKSWFVDFDPVRAKMAGESRESICKRLKLTPEILDLFPDRLVDSELGEIPEGWGNVPFSECVTIIGGGTPKTSVLEYWDGNIPWFSIVDAPIGDGIWVVDTEKKISESGLNNSSTRILPIGTTIITARGTVGRVAIVGVPMAMNQSCYGLRGKYDELGLFTHFSTRLIIKELLQRAHGSVFDTITRDTLESIEVTLPPTGIIDWFERMISLPMERLKQYSEETHIVTMLRDTLLPKLISGEIRVPDVDSIVGDSIRELHRDDLSKGTA